MENEKPWQDHRQHILNKTALGGRKWDKFYSQWKIDSKRPENQIDTYLALCEPQGEIKQMERMGKMLVVHRDFLVSNPSLNFIQEALPLFTKEMGTGPMNDLLQGMVNYPLDLVSGKIKEENNPSLDRVTQAALNLAMPLCGVLAVNLQNNDGFALALALNSFPQAGEFSKLLLSLRNKHKDPTIRSAIAGSWAIIEEALQFFMPAENLSKKDRAIAVPYPRTARFPDRETCGSDLENGWMNLQGQIEKGQKDFHEKGMVLKIQHKDPLTKRLIELYSRFNFQKVQLRDQLTDTPSLRFALITLTPDASLLIANPQFDDGFNPSAQKEWVQKTTIAAVKETREHMSQGELEQPEVSVEQFANIMEFGIRDLDKEASVRLEETKNTISSSLCALTSEGDLVQFGPDEGSGLFNLGIDQVIFHPHEGGAVAQVTVLGTTLDLVFDQSHHLQTIGDYDRFHFPISTICKIEATLLEYVREIRSENEAVEGNGNIQEEELDHEEEQVVIQEGSQTERRRAHLRVLPIHHQSDVYPKHPPQKNKAKREKEHKERARKLREKKHQERAQIMNERVMKNWGISLLELNTLFFIAQGDELHLSGKSKSVLLEGEPLPTGVVELVGSLAKRAHARLTNSDGTLYSVTFVHEGGVEENAMPRVNVCKNAATLISSHFTGV